MSDAWRNGPAEANEDRKVLDLSLSELVQHHSAGSLSTGLVMSIWNRRPPDSPTHVGIANSGTHPNFFLRFPSDQYKLHGCPQDKRHSFPLIFTYNEPVLDRQPAFAQLQDILFASLPPLPES
jgi:hypothetical protein